jgi:hypothetical protein
MRKQLKIEIEKCSAGKTLQQLVKSPNPQLEGTYLCDTVPISVDFGDGVYIIIRVLLFGNIAVCSYVLVVIFLCRKLEGFRIQTPQLWSFNLLGLLVCSVGLIIGFLKTSSNLCNVTFPILGMFLPVTSYINAVVEIRTLCKLFQNVSFVPMKISKSLRAAKAILISVVLSSISLILYFLSDFGPSNTIRDSGTYLYTDNVCLPQNKILFYCFVAYCSCVGIGAFIAFYYSYLNILQVGDAIYIYTYHHFSIL